MRSIGQFKQFFFDRAAVLKDASQKTRKVLSQFGAFVRRDAKGSMRKGKQPSRPGKPPHAHVGLIKKVLYFAYEPLGPGQGSVTIGPAKLNGTKSSTALKALEHGGATKIVSRHHGQPLTKTVHLQARPFMGPAGAKNLPKVPGMWAAASKLGP